MCGTFCVPINDDVIGTVNPDEELALDSLSVQSTLANLNVIMEASSDIVSHRQTPYFEIVVNNFV